MRLYIDPGTGSMLFTILVGILGAGIYALRGLVIKLRFLLSGDSGKKAAGEKQPIVMFADSKRYWNIFGPICREMDRRGKEAVYMTQSPDDPALKEDFKHVKCQFIGAGNKGFAKLNMLKADILISSTPGLDVYQWKRSRDVKWYVHVPHMVSDMTMYRMFGLDFYDAVMLTGEFQGEQIRKLEAARNLPPKELALVGLPYMDELLAKNQAAGPVPEHPTTVLLAPSWGPSGILNKFGSRIFDALLKTGWHVIVRPHPQSYESEKEMLDGLMAAYPASEQLEWNRDNDNFQALRRADILISDFSAVLFDFSLAFDKPVIYADTSYDKAPYDCCWMEDELWTFETLPKIGQKLTEDNLENIQDLITQCLQDVRFQQGREQARKESWNYRGESTSRIVDYLLEKQENLNKED